jgi:hypothetical protein
MNSCADDTWSGVFEIEEDDEEAVASIAISGAVDINGNEMDPDTDNITFQVDTLLPTLHNVFIRSDNIDSAYAKTGDTVSIFFETSEELISSPTVVIVGREAIVSEISALAYQAFLVMQDSDEEDEIEYAIDFIDQAGNIGETVVESSDGSFVILDNTAPGRPSISFDQSEVTRGNKTALSVTIIGGELGAEIEYCVNNERQEQPLISGDGVLTSDPQKISDIDVTDLADGNILMRLKLKDRTGNVSEEATATIRKSINSSSFPLWLFSHQQHTDKENEKSGDNKRKNESGELFTHKEKEIKVLGISFYPNGTLLKGESDRIFLILKSRKKHILDLEELKGYSGKKIIEVSDDELKDYPEWSPQDGDLVRERGKHKIFIIHQGRKRLIRSLDDLRNHFFGKEIYNIGREDMLEFSDE